MIDLRSPALRPLLYSSIVPISSVLKPTSLYRRLNSVVYVSRSPPCMHSLRSCWWDYCWSARSVNVLLKLVSNSVQILLSFLDQYWLSSLSSSSFTCSLTHVSTFGPMIYDNAIPTCWVGMAICSLFLLASLYTLNYCIQSQALAQLPSNVGRALPPSDPLEYWMT